MFTGFTPETIDFLWGIRMNNNREWFQDHKKQYVKTLYEPMKALGQDLFQPFLDRPGNVLKVSRIYRDARMIPRSPTRKVSGSVSARMWSGGRRTLACILRSILMKFTMDSSSGRCAPVPWKISAGTLPLSRMNFWS